MLTLLLLACNCPHPEPLVGGCVLLDSFASDAADTAAEPDTGADGDTGGADADVTVTTVNAVVSSVSQLDSAESPGTGVDAYGNAVLARGVHAGFNGPWTHLALDVDDGTTGDAWFIAGAPGLVAAGQSVRIDVRQGFGGTEFSISDAAGAPRFWVSESSWGEQPSLTDLQGSGITFEMGDEACADQDRCQTTRYHDINVTDPDGTFSVPLGGTTTRGASVYIHGGAQSYDHVSTAWTCGERWGLQDQVALAAVSASAFDSEALWP